MSKSQLYHVLSDMARRHRIKILGFGRVSRKTLEAHKRLVCQAAAQLRVLPLGETVIVEGNRDDIWLVVRSREVERPICCSDCLHSYVTNERRWRPLIKSSFPATHKPTPPGRT